MASLRDTHSDDTYAQDQMSPCTMHASPSTVAAKTPGVCAYPASDDQSSSYQRTANKGSQQTVALTEDIWRPRILRSGPLIGLGALAFAFLQIFASYAVLKASQDQPISKWPVEPSVYLAVLTAISNKALAFATVQGTVITFWLRLVRGTTVGQVQRDWAYGLHLYKALMAGRHFNLLALASVCATFVAIDGQLNKWSKTSSPHQSNLSTGPPLQRASTVRSGPHIEPANLQVSIAPEIPAYFTGYSYYDYLPTTNILDWSNRFLPVVYEHLKDAPIENAIQGCAGTCRVSVLAPALAVERCTSVLQYRK